MPDSDHDMKMLAANFPSVSCAVMCVWYQHHQVWWDYKHSTVAEYDSRFDRLVLGPIEWIIPSTAMQNSEI